MKLVVGATGLVGSEICRLLVEKGQSVRALVRKSSDPEKVAALEKLGVDVAIGDLREPSSLDSACRGVDAVLTTANSAHGSGGDSFEKVDRDGQIALIESAKAAGVSHFVFVSAPIFDERFPLGSAKRAVEEALVSSGLTYTILQPSCFAEVWLSPALGFDAANGSARIYGDGESEISWISYQDVAKFAVESIGHPAAENAVIELGGPEPLSPLTVVKIYEEASGKKFDVQHIPVEALREQFAAAADPLQKSFAGLMLFYAGGHVVDIKGTVADFGIELKSVKDLASST